VGSGRGACPLPVKTLGRVRASFPRARPFLIIVTIEQEQTVGVSAHEAFFAPVGKRAAGRKSSLWGSPGRAVNYGGG
jgi:hypothetical protein